MSNRIMKGTRLGAVSYETDRDRPLSPRIVARYRTGNGEEFEIPFADDAEIPASWECRNGHLGALIDGDGTEAKPKTGKPPRTHWDMLRERRTIEELDVLLNERLAVAKSRRG